MLSRDTFQFTPALSGSDADDEGVAVATFLEWCADSEFYRWLAGHRTTRL